MTRSQMEWWILPLMGSILTVPSEGGEEFWYVPHSAPLSSTATGLKLRISKDGKARGTKYHDKAMLAGVEAIALGVFPADSLVKVRGVETEVSFQVDAHGVIRGVTFDPPAARRGNPRRRPGRCWPLWTCSTSVRSGRSGGSRRGPRPSAMPTAWQGCA